MEDLGLDGKLFLNATPWATVDENGLPLRDQANVARELNQSSAPYISFAQSNGAKVVQIPDKAVKALSEGHQWGAAPFHYADDTYRMMLATLRKWM